AARALAGAGALAAREPEDGRAVDPARVLELPHDPEAAPRHLLLEQAQVVPLRLEQPAERPREADLAAVVEQRRRAPQADVRLRRVEPPRPERGPGTRPG